MPATDPQAPVHQDLLIPLLPLLDELPEVALEPVIRLHGRRPHPALMLAAGAILGAGAVVVGLGGLLRWALRTDPPRQRHHLPAIREWWASQQDDRQGFGGS